MAGRGIEFQNDILEVAERYERKRIMVLRKVEPPVKVIHRRVIFLRNNPFLDFSGSWTERGGRAIHIEAKETSNGILNLNSDHGLKECQMHALRIWNNANAVSAVLWRDRGELFLIPASAIDSLMVAYGRMHLKTSDISKLKIDNLDFVKWMRKWWKI